MQELLAIGLHVLIEDVGNGEFFNEDSEGLLEGLVVELPAKGKLALGGLVDLE